jgi:hypothetical protein
MRNKNIVIKIILVVSLAPLLNLSAPHMHSDNGNGTYTNPVIFADFPGPDVIRGYTRERSLKPKQGSGGQCFFWIRALLDVSRLYTL